jgi:hypothetical protein
MNEKKILVNIDLDLNIDVDTDGYKGKACVNDIKNLFDSFCEIDNFDIKSDYYESEESMIRDRKIKL